MCGIAGWMTKPGCDWRPTKELIVSVVKEMKWRGTDATGIGVLMDNNDLFIYKGAVPADEWAESFKEADIPIGRCGLLHTRGANVGTPEHNYNNHPLPFDPPGNRQVMIVHNGTIGGLKEGYEKLGVAPHAEVDSALIAASLGIKGPRAGLQHLESYSCGSAAVGAVWEDGTFLLARDSAPICVGSPAPGALFFASTPEVLKKFCYDTAWGINILNLLELPNQSFYIWNPDGSLRETGKFYLPVTRPHQEPSYLRERSRKTSDSPPEPQKTRTDLEEEEALAAQRRQVNDGRPIVEPGRRALPPSLTNTDHVKNPDERDRTVDVSIGEAKRINKNVSVICHWAGCWAKARATVPFGGTFVALCVSHVGRAKKQNGTITMANSGELSRKRKEEVKRNAAS